MADIKNHVELTIEPQSNVITVRAKHTRSATRMPYYIRRLFYKYNFLGTISSYGSQYYTENNTSTFGAAEDSIHEFPKDIPLWMIEFQEFYDAIKDLLKIRHPMLRYREKATPENIEKYAGIKPGHKKVNIDGRIGSIKIVIDFRNTEFQEAAADFLHENFPIKVVWYGYKRIKYWCSFPYQGIKDSSYIVSPHYKQLLKPDIETAKKINKYFIESSKFPDGIINNPSKISGKNLENLYQSLNKNDFRVVITNRSGKLLRFLNIDDLLSSPDNDSTIHKILTTMSKDKNVFENNKILYAFNPEEIRRAKKSITDYLIKKDLKKFLNKLETLGKNDTINKTALNNMKKNGFQGIPQPHQETGISWLYNLYTKKAPGAILADEMGMGKTIQAIGFLSAIKSQSRIVIICPASVISVWERELKTFNPKMAEKIGANIKILSYEKALRSGITKTDILILDEAQKVKNNNTLMFKNIAKMYKKFVIILSGTPIENKIDDLFSLLQLLDSSAYDLFQILRRVYSDELSITSKIREIIDPIYLQRKKTKEQLVAKLTINERFVEPTQNEINLQNEIRKVYSDKLLRIKAKNNHDFYSAQIIMAGIMRMRQAISYPGQLPEELIVHFKPKMRSEVNKLIPSKIISLIKLYKEIKKKNEKVVIFAEYIQTVDYLKKELESSGAKVLTLKGSDSSTKRKILIEEFQKIDSKFDVFVISLKAGATGITLTAANNVIIYDLWYNPAVISQALARVHRIGQIKDVNAYLMIEKNTIDDRIYQIFYNKSQLINHFEGTVKENPNVQKAVRDLGKEIFK